MSMMSVRFWRALSATLAIVIVGMMLVGFVVVQKLGGPSYLAFKVRHPGDAAGWSQGRVETFDIAPPTADPPVVFLGDSLTHQIEWGEVFQSEDVVNRGVDGDSAGSMKARLAEVSELRPSQIFVMVGINDITIHTGDEVFADVREIIETLRAHNPKAEVVVQSVLPVNNAIKNQRRSNIEVRALNQRLAAYAAQKGLRYVDLYSRVVDAEGNLRADFTYDGLHLNGRAYRQWVDLVRPLVKVPGRDSRPELLLAGQL